jgi:alpha,alpha-trehalose phosphorylase
MRADEGNLSFSPRLPSSLDRLKFRVRYRDRGIAVTVGPTDATYELLQGAPITLAHHGERFELGAQPVSRSVPRPVELPPPRQPYGREPLMRKDVLGD